MSFTLVPLQRNGVAGCGFCDAAAESLVAAASLSAEDVAGISTLSGKNATVFDLCTPLVSGTQALQILQWCIAGPMWHPFVPWDAHAPLSDARLCAVISHPGGAIGVRLKSKFPHTCWYADNFGLIRDGRHILSVITACLISRSHCFAGNPLSAPYRTAIKWFLNVWIALSAWLSR